MLRDWLYIIYIVFHIAKFQQSQKNPIYHRVEHRNEKFTVIHRTIFQYKNENKRFLFYKENNR